MAMIDQVRFASDCPRVPDAAQLSPLTLALIGDTVYDLYARVLLTDACARAPHELHLAASRRVCAAGQARAFQNIEPLLSPEELAVFRRGRNAHSGTMPKNASPADYHTATGLEALVGWLFLSGSDERLGVLMQNILKDEA